MAASDSEKVNDVFVSLLEMGFRTEDCESALQEGMLSVSDAVEWILNGKPRKPQGPTLHLKRTTSSIFDSEGLPASQESLLDVQTHHVESSSEKVYEKVKSQIRTEERRKQWDDFHEKQRVQAETSAKVEKLQKQKARCTVLQQIAMDRLEKQQLENDAVCLKKYIPENTSAIRPSNSFTISSVTTIQVRYPDGSISKNQFDYKDKCERLWTVIEEKHPDTSRMTLIQPFPRLEISKEDCVKCFEELHLVPSASLILKIKRQDDQSSLTPTPYQRSSEEQSRYHCEPPLATGQLNGNQNDMLSNLGMAEHHLIRPLGNADVHNILRGADEAFDAFGRGRNPPVQHPVIPRIYADMRHIPQQLRREHAWGPGQKLNDQNLLNVIADNPEASPANLASNAAILRAHKIEESTLTGSDCSMSLTTTPITSLVNSCIQVVIKRLLHPSSYSSSLNLPADIAEKLLLNMEKNLLLSPKSLHPFISCHLNSIVLDFYPYATNEILYALRLHTTLQHISLVSCSLINDAGLHHLKPLKRILTLNVRDCKQITDLSFNVFLEWPNLTSLNLEGTKISDLGIQSYIKEGPNSLRHLNVSCTSITDIGLASIAELTHLRSLDMNETQIKNLHHLLPLKQLEGLSLRGTDVSSNSLMTLTELPNLNSLNLSQLLNVEGDDALLVIKDINLVNLQLPSRLTTSDDGLACIKGMNLTSLDLTNYINVTDIGVKHLATMKSLKVLLLSNTKIGDDGLLALQSISNLEVLYLDRTLITDVGTEAFTKFSKLTELSLSYTRIGRKSLKNGNLNHCVSLTKLNLSYTRVTDEGLKKLCLPNLVLISLDGTRLRNSPHVLLVNCQQLQHIMAKNIQQRSLNDSDDESD